jgi:hypothetical protein
MSIDPSEKLTGIIPSGTARFAFRQTTRKPSFNSDTVSYSKAGHPFSQLDDLASRLVPCCALGCHDHRRANVTVFPEMHI